MSYPPTSEASCSISRSNLRNFLVHFSVDFSVSLWCLCHDHLRCWGRVIFDVFKKAVCLFFASTTSLGSIACTRGGFHYYCSAARLTTCRTLDVCRHLLSYRGDGWGCGAWELTRLRSPWRPRVCSNDWNTLRPRLAPHGHKVTERTARTKHAIILYCSHIHWRFVAIAEVWVGHNPVSEVLVGSLTADGNLLQPTGGCKQYTSHVIFFSFTARTCNDVSHDIGSSVCARHPIHVSFAGVIVDPHLLSSLSLPISSSYTWTWSVTLSSSKWMSSEQDPTGTPIVESGPFVNNLPLTGLWAQPLWRFPQLKRPLKFSSRRNPATRCLRTCITRRSVTTPLAERSLHHCSLRSEKNQWAVDKLITLQDSRFLSVMQEWRDPYMNFCSLGSSSRENPSNDSENEQIRFLFERQKEQIFVDCRAEIQKHEFQADSERRSIQELSGNRVSAKGNCSYSCKSWTTSTRSTNSSKQLLEQNRDLREAQKKSLNDMEALKRFQGSTFDGFSRKRLIEDRDTFFQLTGKTQEL